MSELEPKTAENLSGVTTTAAPRPASTGCFFEKLLLDEEDSRARVWKCPHPAQRDGLCIYHLRKPSVDERSTLTATELSTAEQLDTRCRTELATLFAKTQQSHSATAHEFIGFEIPPGFGLSDQKIVKRLNLRFARFCGDAGISLCEIRTADFRNVEFCGRATFAYVEFHDGVQFHDARFCGVAEFSSVRLVLLRNSSSGQRGVGFV